MLVSDSRAASHVSSRSVGVVKKARAVLGQRRSFASFLVQFLLLPDTVSPAAILVQFLVLFWCSFCYFPAQILQSLGDIFRLHLGAVFAALLV